MNTQAPQQMVVSLPIGKLYPHPANPNRMSQARFRKLVRQLELTGQYEPITVRRHPLGKGAYQILNGHHRVRALKQLGRTRADCVVFRADQGQELVYLATLNQLTGRTNPRRKGRLMELLCKLRSSAELAKLLPDTRTAIEKLSTLWQSEATPKPVVPSQAPMLMPMTFFVTEDQHKLITEAFEKAAADTDGTRTEKRLRALCRMAAEYLGKEAG